MFIERILSEGLAHHSYIIGDEGRAAVIDPACDIDRHLAAAGERECTISLIFETHRNEDFVSGAAATGAPVWRGDGPACGMPHARTARHGTRFHLGAVELTTLATPGHTDDSISITFSHAATGASPVGVFTGDTLFVGDVGRTDFYPDRAAEVAGLLHDSLHRVLLPLGDHVAVYPAHGKGSVCGGAIAPRDMTTLGYERRHNPRLQLGWSAFIEAKLSEHHYYPPYFRRMEAFNGGGRPAPATLPPCPPLPLDEVRRLCSEGAQLLDVRSDQAIAGGLVPGALAIPLDMVASFGGWFLDDERPILLVLDRPADRERAVRLLMRIGYANVVGFAAGGFEAWANSGACLDAIAGTDVHQLKQRLQAGESVTLLDVRGRDELAQGRIEGARHVYVGEVEQRLREIPGGPIVTYCTTGRRALVAAAALKRLHRDDVSVCWGSMTAWQKAGYPVSDA